MQKLNSKNERLLCLELRSRFYPLVTPDWKCQWDSNMGYAVWTRAAFGKIHVENDGLCLSGRTQQTVSDSEWRIRAREFSACRHRDLEEQALRHDTKVARW